MVNVFTMRHRKVVLRGLCSAHIEHASAVSFEVTPEENKKAF